MTSLLDRCVSHDRAIRRAFWRQDAQYRQGVPPVTANVRSRKLCLTDMPDKPSSPAGNTEAHACYCPCNLVHWRLGCFDVPYSVQRCASVLARVQLMTMVCSSDESWRLESKATCQL
ncbi:hypothetical protein M3J07_006260 [Ascochyta lentis]